MGGPAFGWSLGGAQGLGHWNLGQTINLRAAHQAKCPSWLVHFPKRTLTSGQCVEQLKSELGPSSLLPLRAAVFPLGGWGRWVVVWSQLCPQVLLWSGGGSAHPGGVERREADHHHCQTKADLDMASSG